MVKTFEKYTSVALLCMSLSLFSCAGVPGKSSAHTNVSDSEQKTVNKNGKKLLLVHKGSDMSQEHRADYLNEYMQTLQNIVFKAQNIPDETQNGKAFSSAFTALITNTNGKALANENISVKYPSGINDGEPVYALEELQSDENGTVSFNAPVPEFSCNAQLLFYPTPSTMEKEVLEYAEQHALQFPFKVRTNKRTSPLSIAILDYSASGKPITNNSLSSSALLKAVYRKGFRSAGNSDFVSEINDGNIEKLYKSASALFRGTIKYLIFGTVKYVQPIEKTEAGLYKALMQADISVMEMGSGKIILHKVMPLSAEDKSEWNVLDLIRNKIFATEMADSLYYGL